ncbi:hypothetical protein RDV89_12940 [Nocardioides zeae]|uniref:SRPBCC family protein n=1 Tax=Nocardioides imazamoxiresistens TaxID=3231893 RepID=A0ABU3PXK9_9ACTN|nr:hypothetical protein [Nocardioides zeae]MDT9593981.1 hypothetical protein [Nocardioides zeae]
MTSPVRRWWRARARPIYVETRVRGDLETLWQRTQVAGEHTRWDVRFSEITDVEQQEADAPRVFRYALHLPLRTVAGTGTSVGERWRPDGSCTSALRFGSPDPLSLIRRGSGWWRYVPTDEGVRFLTGFDYEPGWGPLGAVVDRAGFRRLVGWGTAWSFDRLRLWVEDGVPPETALRRALLDLAARGAFVGVAAGAAGAASASSRRGVRRLTVALALGAAGAVATAAPPLPGAPRARRTLRRPPDRVARQAPDTLATLRSPT